MVKLAPLLFALFNVYDKRHFPPEVKGAEAKENAVISMPPGCTCQNIEKQDRGSQCETFDCGCACDVRKDLCDVGCCCDPDCRAQDFAGFSHSCGLSGLRTNNVGNSLPLPTCSEYYANGRWAGASIPASSTPSQLEDFVQDAMGAILCIKTENSAVKGHFFHNNHSLRGELTLNEMKPTDFSRIQIMDHAQKNIGTGKYATGDYLQAIRKGDDSDPLHSVDILNLPASSDGGFCNQINGIEFGMTTHSVCSTMIGNLAQDCAGRLSIQRYVDNLSVLKNRTSFASVNYDSIKESLVDIEIISVERSNGTSLDQGHFENLSTTWVGEDEKCLHAVESLVYEVSIDTDGIIMDITASIVVTDVPIGTKSIQQEFYTAFTRIPKPQLISGNPGYIIGSPTLAGKKGENSTFVEHSHFGLTVSNIGKNGGSCTATSKSFVIGFGEDSVVGCTLALTMDELKNLCSHMEHPYLKNPPEAVSDDVLVPKWLIQDLTMVGIFGNADSADISQWLQISSSVASESYKVKSRIWNPTNNKCDGLITGLNYRIGWTYAGNVKNPQAKIVSVEQNYVDNIPMSHKIDPSKAQNYYFTTSTSWIFIDSDVKALTLPPPSLFLTVPDDVFYPFDFN